MLEELWRGERAVFFVERNLVTLLYDRKDPFVLSYFPHPSEKMAQASSYWKILSKTGQWRTNISDVHRRRLP